MWRCKSQKYLFGLTPYFDKVMQNKKMKQIRINKNKKLHWGNRSKDMLEFWKF